MIFWSGGMSMLSQYLPDLLVVTGLLCAEPLARAPRTDLLIKLMAWPLYHGRCEAQG